MKARFSVSGSSLPGWVCPTKEGRIILKSLESLKKLRDSGKLEYDSCGNGWAHFTMYRDGKARKTATYTDTVIEDKKTGDFIAHISLTFTHHKKS